MNTLVLRNQAGKDVTTSLIIAEVFEKDHDKVCRDIKNLECSMEFRTANFGDSSYKSLQNKDLLMYEINKDGFSFLVMGYTGVRAAEFKEKFINEFNKREALLKNDDYIISRAMSVLSDRAKALEQQIQQKDERLQLQEHVIKEAAPKVEYYEKVLQAEGLILTNVIAKEMGMSAITLNRILNKERIIYRCGQTWVLFEQYQNKGYAATKTFTYTDDRGLSKTAVHTYWTEKGREFIHKRLSKVNYSKIINN